MNKKRILLVDDEKSLTTLLKLNLEETGDYEVRVENFPEDALAAVRAFQPDLVLLDLIMPRLPGGNVASSTSSSCVPARVVPTTVDTRCESPA